MNCMPLLYLILGCLAFVPLIALWSKWFDRWSEK